VGLQVVEVNLRDQSSDCELLVVVQAAFCMVFPELFAMIKASTAQQYRSAAGMQLDKA
jgi:hypothetical protein